MRKTMDALVFSDSVKKWRPKSRVWPNGKFKQLTDEHNISYHVDFYSDWRTNSSIFPRLLFYSVISNPKNYSLPPLPLLSFLPHLFSPEDYGYSSFTLYHEDSLTISTLIVLEFQFPTVMKIKVRNTQKLLCSLWEEYYLYKKLQFLMSHFSIQVLTVFIGSSRELNSCDYPFFISNFLFLRIVQYYVAREESGMLASNKFDRNKVMRIQAK